MDCSLPGSSVHGIFQARVLEWGAINMLKNYNSGESSLTLKKQNKNSAQISTYIKLTQTHWTNHENESESESEVTQSCPTLCDPMDCSPAGSSVHGIFQARVLEWGAIAFSHPYVEILMSHVMVLRCGPDSTG